MVAIEAPPINVEFGLAKSAETRVSRYIGVSVPFMTTEASSGSLT